MKKAIITMNEIEHIKSCFFGIPKNGIKVIWEVTNNCQLNCIHCCNSIRRCCQKDRTDISFAKAKNIIEELNQYQIGKIVLTGGDPLEYTHIFKLIKYIQSFDIDVSLSTNGTLLGQYYDKIIEVSPLKIVIGIYGFLPHTNDNFCRKIGSFNQILSGVEKLLSHGIEVEFHYTVNNRNVYEVEDLINYANEKGIKVSLSNIIQIKEHPLISEYIISEEGFENALIQINPARYSNVQYIRNKKGILERCPAGDKIIGILSNGKFTPCPWLSNFSRDYDTNNLENVFEFTKSLDKFFHNSLCNKCSISKCGKGCPAAALSIQKTFDPLCPRRKKK